MSSDQLDESVHKAISELCRGGDVYAESGQLELATEKYRDALALLPQPCHDWEAATWIFVAIGDALFQRHDFSGARDALLEATRCPGGVGNPFLHLRLGQVQLELRNLERAKDELARAYMGGGDELFEEEDPKYLNFIKEILRPREDL